MNESEAHDEMTAPSHAKMAKALHFYRNTHWRSFGYTERPCAAAGLTSYRYAARYGHIMIGATSTQDALNEADRSLTQGAATVDRLEIWNALTGLYEKVTT